MQKNQIILSIHSLEIQKISEFHDLRGHTHFGRQVPKNRHSNLIY